jgi:hypothetical protein
VRPEERLLRAVLGRDLTVHLSEGFEIRLRANIDRYNREIARSPHFTAADRLDASDDAHLAIVFAACADRGMHDAEEDDGLYGTDWGELMTLEQRREIDRRRVTKPEGAE